ncbi:MAG: hypothetical protein IMF19_08405, partial [Proteobacteria bacterium]|nr:hypothetical protein [Pseudomonadota bacterium]
KTELEKLVKDIFSKKEDSDKKEMLVEALENAKSKLVEASNLIAEKDSEIAEMTTKIEELNVSVDTLTASATEKEETLKAKEEELTGVSKELETEKAKIAEHESAMEKKDVEVTSMKEEFDKVSSELDTIKTDAVVEKRMSALEEAGLLRSDEEGVTAQREKVSAFSDEEYETYKTELEEIKASIVASLKDKKIDPKDKDKGNTTLNLEGDDDEPTIKEIGEALSDLFYGDKEKK